MSQISTEGNKKQDKRHRSFSNKRTTFIFSDLNDNFTRLANSNYEAQKRQLKAFFVESNKDASANYIKDLERTVEINKEIITELLKDKEGMGEGTVCEKLNAENAVLQKRIAEVMRLNEEIQVKLLIAEQVISELKVREEESKLEFDEKRKELFNQLNRKEYILQMHERRYMLIEGLLGKYAKQEQEVFMALKDMNLEMQHEPKCIKNVVVENDTLSKKLVESKSKIAELESQIVALTKENEKTMCEEKYKIVQYKVPSLDLSKLKKYPACNPSYVHKLEETIKLKNKEIELLKSENKSLQEKVKELDLDCKKLFGINEKLGKTLQEATSRFDRLKSTSFNKTRMIRLNGMLSNDNAEFEVKNSKSTMCDNFLGAVRKYESVGEAKRAEADFGASERKGPLAKDQYKKDFGNVSDIKRSVRLNAFPQ
eukprot:TRINITY_DN6112_c0_g2_i2.p1 TRINITY_DN6112_c0_g2~~TRINITY_DN6112_c0_g2_i2.p1  ORF type:complete len:427 (+),score=147.50 TRINITY_DN6112_c0_g2_i2:204-1484(+)